MSDDTIYRQAAIDAIRHSPIIEVQPAYMLIDKADVLKNLVMLPSAQRTGRWTPVSEGLPKAGECVGNVIKYYLVQNEFGDMLVARYTHGGYWEQMYQYKPCADEIVAWMPLPEPYKEEK